MSYSFGRKSLEQYNTLDERLRKVLKRAIEFGVMDFSIVEGHRSIQRQKKLYAEGLSKKDGVKKLSKHNNLPSLAVDLIPYPIEANGIRAWQDKPRQSKLAGIIFAAASIEGIKIRWGGDWDNDGNNNDSNFDDFPHFELI